MKGEGTNGNDSNSNRKNKVSVVNEKYICFIETTI
jgi:hypothetical protein